MAIILLVSAKLLNYLSIDGITLLNDELCSVALHSYLIWSISTFGGFIIESTTGP